MPKPPKLTKRLPHKAFKQFCLNLDLDIGLARRKEYMTPIQKVLANLAMGTQGRYARTDEAARALMRNNDADS